MPRISLSIRLGPMVHFDVQGENCAQVAQALTGFEQLNEVIDAMCSDLANRVYPEGPATAPEEEPQEPRS